MSNILGPPCNHICTQNILPTEHGSCLQQILLALAHPVESDSHRDTQAHALPRYAHTRV